MSQQHDSVVKAPAEVEMPMDVNEPMQSRMMKKGMMKSDVRKSAEQKDEKMKELFSIVDEERYAFPSISFTHLPRTHAFMKKADALVNYALDRRTV